MRGFVLFAAVLALAGCAGDGSALPMGMGGPTGPTLASLQTSIFTPFCAACHRPGGIGPMPLDTEAATIASLVGVDSLGIPGLPRVDPIGDPDNSYLIWKLEGRPGIVGSPMPLGAPMLSPDQINDIADWIREGAMP